jgi:hypothetical protein
MSEEENHGEAGVLFDRSQFDREDLQIPTVDGQTIDRIAIKFAGEVFLDRSDPADVALYNSLELGGDIQLLVTAKCSGTGAKLATDRGGELDVTVGGKGVRVVTLAAPAGAKK